MISVVSTSNSNKGSAESANGLRLVILFAHVIGSPEIALNYTRLLYSLYYTANSQTESMGLTISSLFTSLSSLVRWSKDQDVRILMLGLDSAGKVCPLAKMTLLGFKLTVCS
jgi:hypothetical protein